MSEQKTCETCAYFYRPWKDMNANLQCRRKAPVRAANDNTPLWPAVWLTDWCGDYERAADR